MPTWPGFIVQGCQRAPEHSIMPMEDHGPSAVPKSLTHGTLSIVWVAAGQKQVEAVLLGQPGVQEKQMFCHSGA